MKATYRLEDVEGIEATLSLTMSIRDWKALLVALRQADNGYPQWKVAALIAQLIAKAHGSFTATEERDT